MPRKIWQIEDYDDETRHIIKTYAVMHQITIAEALKQIVKLANIQLPKL